MMSSKRLLPLAALLIVLIIAAVMLKRQPIPSKLSDEAGFERLVPQTLHTSRITGLDIYQGMAPQEIIRLRKEAHAWVVTSYYNAPVQAKKMTSFLNILSGLEGEVRADSAEFLADFRLEPAQALHLQVYVDNSETAALHLLAGKHRGRYAFVRLSDHHRVYSVNLNLHHEAGLYGRDSDQSPQAKPWIDLRIQDFRSAPITQITLHTPARRWRFIRQQQTVASSNAWGETPKTKPQWGLAEPNLEYAVKQDALDSLARTLRTLRAEDIADPANRDGYGLETSLYRALVVLQPERQESREVTLWVGHETPEQAGTRYARVGTEGPVYMLSQRTFNRLFPKGKDLLDLPSLALEEKAIQQIALISGTRTVQLTRSTEPTLPNTDKQNISTWSLTSPHPHPAFIVRQSKVERLAGQLATLTPDDVAAVHANVTPLSLQTLPGIEIVLRDASRHVIRLGPPPANHPHQYVLYLNTEDVPFSIDQKTRDSIFPSLNTLFDFHPLRIQPQEITHLTWQRDDKIWSLDRLSSAVSTTVTWKLVEPLQTAVNTQTVNALLTTISELTADDWVERPRQGGDAQQAGLTLDLTQADGRTEQIALSRSQHGYYLKIQGAPGLFIVPASSYEALVKALMMLSESLPTSSR